MCKPAVAIENILKAQQKASSAAVPKQPAQTVAFYPPISEDMRVTCPECDILVPYRKVEEHLGLCPQLALACPNGCGELLKRKDLQDHLNDVCLLSIVPCPYGCAQKDITRRTLQIHLEENMDLHVQNLAKKVEDQEKLIKTLEKAQSMGCLEKAREFGAGLKNAWNNTAARKQFIQQNLPPTTIFTIVMLCLALLMLSKLSFFVQAVFLFICWRKHPKADATGGAKALFRLKAMTALSFLFICALFPFWLVLFVAAPVVWLLYVCRDEIMTSLQKVINA